MRPCWLAQSATVCHSRNHIHTHHSGCNTTPGHKTVFFYTTNLYNVVIRGQPPSTGRPHTGREEGGRLRRRAWVRNRVSRWHTHTHTHTHTALRTYMLSVCLLQLCLKYKISPTPHFRNKKVTDHDVTDSMEQSPSWESNNHQLAKKFPALYGTRSFVTSFIGSCHLFASLDQSSPCSHPTSWRSILILSSHLRLGLPSGLFPSGPPPPKNLASTSHDSFMCYMSHPSHSPWFNQPNNILCWVELIKLLVM